MLRSTQPPRCKHCRERTEKIGKLLHDHCIEPWLASYQKKKQAKQKSEIAAKARVERAQIKARRRELETIPELKRAAQTAVNKYVRLRDLHRGYGCISCGAKPEQAYGGTLDAGHFRSVGAAPHLRFFLPQIALQCVRCNRYLSGNVVEFRKGLVERRGLEFVEAVECMQGSAKWDADYLRRLRKVMLKKARRLEKKQ